jgi:hypothetical protein
MHQPKLYSAKHAFGQQQRLATQEEREELAMKKKIALLCTAAVMIAVLAVGGTLAYLTYFTPTAENTFMLGEVEGFLTENGNPDAVDETGLESDNIFVNWDKKDIEGNPDPEEATGIAPGQTVQKAPVVKLGTNSRAAYVRLTVTGVDFTKDLEITDDYSGGEDFTPVGLNVGEGAGQWTYGGEGENSGECYFYYNDVLKNPEDPDDDPDATSALFTGVTLKTDVAEGPLNNITVKADLIQASYLEGAIDSVEDAFDLFDAQ